MTQVNQDPFDAGQKSYNALQYAFFIGGKDQIVVRADTPEELASLIEGLAGDGSEEAVVSRILNTMNAIRAATIAISLPENKPTSGNAPTPTQTQSAPQNSNGAPMCRCGLPRIYRQDKNNPPTWAAWYCPQDRDSQCSPRSLKTTPRSQ